MHADQVGPDDNTKVAEVPVPLRSRLKSNDYIRPEPRNPGADPEE